VGDGRNEFEDLERELHESLTARSAPLGFTTRVMARIDARKKSAAARVPLWRWVTAVAALAATCLALVVGGRYERQRQEQIEGEHAREQVILALRITHSTLEEVRLKVEQKGKDTRP
jgi:anti-sigma-K factor RskA